MTCIVGLVDGGRVFVGGDSAGVSGLSLQVRADEKVFRNGPFVMGFTSSFRVGQLLRYRLRPGAHPDGVCALEFMATVFVDEVRRCLKEGGAAKKENEIEEGGTFLVGYRGRLFRVDDDYQVGEMRAPSTRSPATAASRRPPSSCSRSPRPSAGTPACAPPLSSSRRTKKARPAETPRGVPGCANNRELSDPGSQPVMEV
jgi:hypothetical protein